MQGNSVHVMQALLTPFKAKIRKDERIQIEWKLVNLGRVPVEVSGLHPVTGLTVTGPDGRIRVVRAFRPERPRTAYLAPGEYLGGTFDLRVLSSDMEEPGVYRILWRATIKLDQKPKAVDSASVVIEILKE